MLPPATVPDAALQGNAPVGIRREIAAELGDGADEHPGVAGLGDPLDEPDRPPGDPPPDAQHRVPKSRRPFGGSDFRENAFVKLRRPPPFVAARSPWFSSLVRTDYALAAHGGIGAFRRGPEGRP